MRVLIYGFKPYGGFKANVTQDIVRELSSLRNTTRKVFDVRFDERQFNAVLQRAAPQLIIGLGQHPRARKLRLERRAINRWVKRAADDGLAGRPARTSGLVRKGGQPAAYVNLTLPRTPYTTTTYCAGTYVCNFSMYLMCEYCAANGARFAFVHVPRFYSPQKAARYIERAVKAARASPKTNRR